MSARLINYSEADVDMRDVELRSLNEMENIRPLDGRAGERSLPWHSIFLSHSGYQKPFVEQLCWDLENRGHTVFFDKNADSLPKGKEFPELIVQAARHCVVAVVVLSHEYLTSKWPMLELVAFVEAKRTCNPRLYILPVFYKLNVEDLKDTHRWRTEWQQRGFQGAQRGFQGAQLDTRKCEEALRVLARSNGERFSEYGKSEVRYRKAIVAGLYRLSRPYLKYCSPPMVARSRLRQIIAEELERQSRVDGTGPAVLGVYGLGGMGKTLLCRSMCNFYREEYAGRVCHVECSKSSSSLDLQNLILEELTDGRKPVFDSSEEALNSIALHLPREAVFLAMDNVQEADVQWLQSILNANHNPKSKFLVTSRSASNVQSVLRNNKGSCWAIEKHLSLTENEALELFLRSAVPTLDLRIPCSYLTDHQILNILKDCIKECFFGTGAHQSGQYYYPMLLQVFGSSIKEQRCSNFLHFIDKCRRWGKLHHFHKHPVFEILRTEYDALHIPRGKLLFHDVALFAPRQKLLKLEDLCSWLEGMYDCSRDEILHKLWKLRKSSLIEDWETNNQITLHDLYKDFAAYELQEVEAEKRWAVYHKSISSDLPQNLASSPPGRNWPDLVRICIKIESQLPGGHSSPNDNNKNLHLLPSIVLETAPVPFPSRKKIQQWENVQLLCLQGFESAVLDIGPLKCLRSLKLESYTLRTLKGTEKLEQLRFVELNCSGLKQGLEFPKCSKLQELVTGEIHELRSLQLPESLCSSLKLFKLHGWNGTLPRELELGHHRELTEVAIAHTIWDVSGRVNCLSLSLLGLGLLTRLIGLTLINLPVFSLPGLEKLELLQFLDVRGCACLEVLPDLRSLVWLKWVWRHGCLRLPRSQPSVSSQCRVTTSSG